jgi:GR25 family glycosyltransferase involved in LPS biosynthesis
MSWRIENIPAFCITLERRSDRWKRFVDQYGVSQGFPHLRRFLGVDGKELDVISDNRIAIPTKRNIIIKERRSHEEIDSLGAVGCALSHIAIWQWMVDNKEPLVLVFEDDAVVPPDFVSRANHLISSSITLQNTAKWDIWLIGAKWKLATKLERSSQLEVPATWFLTHCYIITLPYASFLLKNSLPVTTHIDFWMATFGQVHRARQVATPLLQLEQYERAKTDIQTNNANTSVVDIPTNFSETHTLVSKADWAIARTAEVICLALAIYLFYSNALRKL